MRAWLLFALTHTASASSWLWGSKPKEEKAEKVEKIVEFVEDEWVVTNLDEKQPPGQPAPIIQSLSQPTVPITVPPNRDEREVHCSSPSPPPIYHIMAPSPEDPPAVDSSWGERSQVLLRPPTPGEIFVGMEVEVLQASQDGQFLDDNVSAEEAMKGLEQLKLSGSFSASGSLSASGNLSLHRSAPEIPRSLQEKKVERVDMLSLSTPIPFTGFNQQSLDLDLNSGPNEGEYTSVEKSDNEKEFANEEDDQGAGSEFSVAVVGSTNDDNEGVSGYDEEAPVDPVQPLSDIEMNNDSAQMGQITYVSEAENNPDKSVESKSVEKVDHHESASDEQENNIELDTPSSQDDENASTNPDADQVTCVVEDNDEEVPTDSVSLSLNPSVNNELDQEDQSSCAIEVSNNPDEGESIEKVDQNESASGEQRDSAELVTASQGSESGSTNSAQSSSNPDTDQESNNTMEISIEHDGEAPTYSALMDEQSESKHGNDEDGFDPYVSSDMNSSFFVGFGPLESFEATSNPLVDGLVESMGGITLDPSGTSDNLSTEAQHETKEEVIEVKGRLDGGISPAPKPAKSRLNVGHGDGKSPKSTSSTGGTRLRAVEYDDLGDSNHERQGQANRSQQTAKFEPKSFGDEVVDLFGYLKGGWNKLTNCNDDSTSSGRASSSNGLNNPSSSGSNSSGVSTSTLRNRRTDRPSSDKL